MDCKTFKEKTFMPKNVKLLKWLNCEKEKNLQSSSRIVTVAVDVKTLVSASELVINTWNCSLFSTISSSLMLIITTFCPVSPGWNVTVVVGICWKSVLAEADIGETNKLKKKGIYKEL